MTQPTRGAQPNDGASHIPSAIPTNVGKSWTHRCSYIPGLSTLIGLFAGLGKAYVVVKEAAERRFSGKTDVTIYRESHREYAASSTSGWDCARMMIPVLGNILVYQRTKSAETEFGQAQDLEAQTLKKPDEALALTGKALALYQSAADKGHPGAQMQIARHHIKALNVNFNMQTALTTMDLLEKAGSQGIIEAHQLRTTVQEMIGWHLIRHSPEQVEEGKQWLKDASSLGGTPYNDAYVQAEIDASLNRQTAEAHEETPLEDPVLPGDLMANDEAFQATIVGELSETGQTAVVLEETPLEDAALAGDLRANLELGKRCLANNDLEMASHYFKEAILATNNPQWARTSDASAIVENIVSAWNDYIASLAHDPHADDQEKIDAYNQVLKFFNDVMNGPILPSPDRMKDLQGALEQFAGEA